MSGVPRSCSRSPKGKWALEFIKKRVETHICTKSKRDELSIALATRKKAVAWD